MTKLPEWLPEQTDPRGLSQIQTAVQTSIALTRTAIPHLVAPIPRTLDPPDTQLLHEFRRLPDAWRQDAIDQLCLLARPAMRQPEALTADRDTP